MCLFYTAGCLWGWPAQIPWPQPCQSIKQHVRVSLSTGQSCPRCWMIKMVWWDQFEWGNLAVPHVFPGYVLPWARIYFAMLPWFRDHSQQTTCQDVLRGERFYWYRCRLFHSTWPVSQAVPLGLFVYGCSCQGCSCANVVLCDHSW